MERLGTELCAGVAVESVHDTEPLAPSLPVWVSGPNVTMVTEGSGVALITVPGPVRVAP